MNLDDGTVAGTIGSSSGTSAGGRMLRYLLLGILTALVAGGVASWVWVFQPVGALCQCSVLLRLRTHEAAPPATSAVRMPSSR